MNTLTQIDTSAITAIARMITAGIAEGELLVRVAR
jgi:hypothetical protein